ncbi:MAG TPA: MerR family transcriptional regulator [Gammaproteobacteria bacterium]|nr:MerR family transcriptional regulator [Gammaproteobacteria bacterium]
MRDKQKTSAGEQKRRDYKIGEVAERLNTTPRTLRFYEEQGMLMPFRTAKGTRLYSDEDIARLEVIQHLVRLDVPLRTIRELAVARPGSRSGDEASHKVFELLNELRIDVEKKKRECENAQQQIATALQLVEQCFGCRNKPAFQSCKDCSVAGQIDRSRLFHLIWDQAQAGT